MVSLISIFSIIFAIQFVGFKDKSLVKCPSCNLSPLNKPTSTRRDVILTSALTKLKNVEYFIRTLRSTGCKARVILFLDSKQTASIKWRSLFAACDIEPVFIKHTNPVVQSAPKLSRYYFEQQWLKENVDKVDRIIHTDSFDVIFQSDPFIEMIKNDRLYFTFEPVTLANSLWTASWMNQCYSHTQLSNFTNRLVSCSGVTAGSGKLFLKYLDLLLATPQWTTCFGHSLDQAHHNYLLFSGAFERAGIKIEGFGCDSPFLTMHFCCKKTKCHLDDNGVMYGNGTTAPVLVHQYNRWKNLTKRNPEWCPAPKAGVLSLTKNARPAKVTYLPPLETAFPEKTLPCP